MNKLLSLILLTFISINAVSFDNGLDKRKTSGKRALDLQIKLQDIENADMSQICRLCELLPKKMRESGYQTILNKFRNSFQDYSLFAATFAAAFSDINSLNFTKYLIESELSDAIFIKQSIISDNRLWCCVVLSGNLLLVKYIISIVCDEFPAVIKHLMASACEYGQLEIAQYILHYMKAFNFNINECIAKPSIINKSDTRYRFFTRVNNYMEWACMSNCHMVNFLIGNGAYVNFDINRLFDIVQCNTNYFNIIKYLIESGKIINFQEQDNNGDTILHKACYFDMVDLVKYLIENNLVDIDIQNSLGETILHLYCERLDYSMVKYLVSKGANVNIKKLDRKTPMYSVCNSEYIEEMHEKHIAIDIIKCLIDSGRMSDSNYSNLQDFDLDIFDAIDSLHGYDDYERQYESAKKKLLLLELLEELDYRIEYVKTKHLGDNANEREVMILHLKQGVERKSQALNEEFDRIKYTKKTTTFGKFNKIKKFLKESILAANSDDIKRIFWEYNTNIFFSNSQMADLIIEKMRYKKYDDLAMQALIEEVWGYYPLDKIKHICNHILWYTLRSHKYRNLSKLIIKLCPDLIKNVPDDMYEICAQEMIAICADESGIKYSWNGANIN